MTLLVDQWTNRQKPQPKSLPVLGVHLLLRFWNHSSRRPRWIHAVFKHQMPFQFTTFIWTLLIEQFLLRNTAIFPRQSFSWNFRVQSLNVLKPIWNAHDMDTKGRAWHSLDVWSVCRVKNLWTFTHQITEGQHEASSLKTFVERASSVGHPHLNGTSTSSNLAVEAYVLRMFRLCSILENVICDASVVLFRPTKVKSHENIHHSNLLKSTRQTRLALPIPSSLNYIWKWSLFSFLSFFWGKCCAEVLHHFCFAKYHTWELTGTVTCATPQCRKCIYHRISRRFVEVAFSAFDCQPSVALPGLLCKPFTSICLQVVSLH